MKIPGLILFLLLPSMISVAQIERKPSPSKQVDSILSQPGNSMNNRKDLLKDLDLNREQKMKLKEIRQASMAKKEAIENNGQLPEEEKKKQLRELQKEQAKNVQAILTDEQKKKFKAKKQEMIQENN